MTQDDSNAPPQCLATLTQPPYQCTWNTEATDSNGNRIYPDGDYTIQVVAIQASTASISLDVNVDTTLAPIAITQPTADGSVISDSGDVSYQETGATSVGLWMFGSSEPFQLGSTAPPDGIYQLQAVACYSDGSMAYSPRTWVVVADNSAAVTSVAGLDSTSNPLFLINVPVVAGTSPAMGGAFYVEDPNRAAGIRVQSSATIATGENVGNYILDNCGFVCYTEFMSTDNTPQTLLEMIRLYSDPKACHDAMVGFRWSTGVVCPHCGSKTLWFTEKRLRWQCKDCKKQFTVKVGTIFEDSALSLSKWLPAVWLISNCKNGISSCELARSIGVTQKTAWFSASPDKNRYDRRLIRENERHCRK